jgi:hypothetical protein
MVFQARCLVLVCRAVIQVAYAFRICSTGHIFSEWFQLARCRVQDIDQVYCDLCLHQAERLIIIERNQLKLKDASAG